MFSECVKLFEEIPSEIYESVNKTLQKKTPKALTELLSSETRDIIRYQVKKVKIIKKDNKKSNESKTGFSDNDNESLTSKMINKYKDSQDEL